MLFLCLTGILIGAVYKYLKNRYTVFEELGIPGPKPVLLFGNTPDFKDRFPLDVLDAWTEKYGRVYGFYEGLQPSIVVSDPYLTQQILVKNFLFFYERPQSSPFWYELEDKSLNNANGELWKRERQIVVRAFSSTGLQEFVPVVTSVSKRMLLKLEEMGPALEDGFDITDIMDRYNVDAFANAAFDYNNDSLNEDDNLLLNYMKAFSFSAGAENPVSGLAKLFPILKILLRLFDEHHRNLHSLHLDQVRAYVEKQKQMLQHNNSASTTIVRRLIEGYSVFLDDENNEVKRHLSEDEMTSQVLTLVGAGFGPIHAIVAFAIYLLARNPRVQDKLRDEIVNVCPLHETITTDKLSRLEYLNCVIDETIRMYPAAPGVARICTANCEIDGIKFVKGHTVRIMATSMYKNEKYYPQANKFIPERFNKVERGDKPFYSFLPIGHGPRMCPGFKFACAQIKIAIVQLLRHYIIATSPQTEIPLQTALRPFLCPKNGVYVRLIKR